MRGQPPAMLPPLPHGNALAAASLPQRYSAGVPHLYISRLLQEYLQRGNIAQQALLLLCQGC